MSILEAQSYIQNSIFDGGTPRKLQFGYLQVYSNTSRFGGLNSAGELATTFNQVAKQFGPIAVALTDSFSLRNIAEWNYLLSEEQIVPIIGAEISVKFPNSSTLPSALIVLVENEQGYQNLCSLISLGLQEAGIRPLTAALETEQLLRHHDGLIAISPYYGGPVAGALRGGKGATEAKNRVIALRDIFGADNFFLGVTPVTTASLPAPTLESIDIQVDASIKINSALTKIAREQRIGLIVTGETRYCEAKQANDYAALKSHLGRALAEQFQPSQLQQKFDWLYSLSSGHPTSNLQVQTPASMQNRYSQAEWPDALANNYRVVSRCTLYRLPDTAHIAQSEIRRQCLQEISRRYAGEMGKELPEEVETRAWLENELEEIAELGLASALLAAAKIYQEASSFQVLMARWIGGSLVAYLLGLTERAPIVDAFKNSPYSRFEALSDNRPLRIETGRDGRERLIMALNSNVGAIEPNQWVCAPVAVPSSEAGALPIVHPRLTAFSSTPSKIAEYLPLQPAQADSTGITRLAVQVSATTGNISVLEIRQSAALARLQLAMDLTNTWKQHHGQEPLEIRHLPRAPENDYDTPNEFERALIRERLRFFQVTFPAAFYAATLSLVDPEQRPAYSEAARQNNLSILTPSVNQSRADFSVVDENTLQVGLAAILGHTTANKLLEARGTHFADLNDFAYKSELDASQLTRLIWSGALDEFGPREALADIANKIVQTGKRHRERQNQSVNQINYLETATTNDSQPSLFSFMSLNEIFAQPEPLIEEIPLLQLPDNQVKLSTLEYLEKQHQVLNFYTSEHPLWALRPVPRRDAAKTDFTPLSNLAAAEEDKKSDQNIRVAGLVLSLRRLQLTDAEGKGQELTVLKLEDWDGRAEILIPPGVVEISGLENLTEGMAIAALVRTDTLQATPVPLVVAEALAAFSTQSDLFNTASDEDKFDIEAELEKLKKETIAAALAELETSPSTSPSDSSNDSPPDDWSASLFEAVGADQPGNTITSESKSTGKNSKETSKDKKPPRPLRKRVNIFMPSLDTDDAEEELARQVAELLRRHPGEDLVHIYVPKDGGGWQRFETMSLYITYGPEFEQEAKQLLGQNGFKVEEY